MDVRRLDARDDRASFRCGDEALDRFFAQQAGQGLERALSATYVLAEQDRIVGFVTVTPQTVLGKDLGIPRLPPAGVPALLLARMGIALDCQGRGLGGTLVAKAMSLSLAMADQVGCVALVVDAKPSAHGFYERLGFSWLGPPESSGTRRGAVPIQTLRKARS